MKVSMDFLVRMGGMVALTYMAFEMGGSLSDAKPSEMQQLATQLLMLAGAGLGLIVTPRLTIVPIKEFLQYTRTIPLVEILFITIGATIGLLLGVLLAVPLSFLPMLPGQYLPTIVTLVLMYIGAMTFILHKRTLDDVVRWMQRHRTTSSTPHNMPIHNDTETTKPHRYLIDTSTIIDGRIAIVGKTGFIDGIFLVPQFVLLEMQTLADSSDELRRGKGRRGLELLSTMQKEDSPPVEIIDIDIQSLTRVDDKLVALARQYQCPIITNDFNLNRVAELQGVKVLNLNQLSDALRPTIVQDQVIQVLIRNEGNARQQGVGYLDDGTPVIVEEARDLIGTVVDVIVTRLHQTQTGRLVFAQLPEKNNHRH